MIAVYRAADRGHFNHGWLDTYHTFSFSEYFDPTRMGFRSLRVINEDRVAAGGGFGMHPHRDMEIVTLVLSGRLEHLDSLGNGAVIEPGELQVMSAGTGIRHSEFNPSAEEAVHLYQIWLQPRAKGLPPRYDQRKFAAEHRNGRWQVVASPDGRDNSLTIEQDATLALTRLEPGVEIEVPVARGRAAWLQVIRGELECNGEKLTAGDAVASDGEAAPTLRATAESEVLWFDLA